MDESDAFTQAISLQAAARSARPRLTYFERQQAIREIDLQERRLRSFKLVLAFAIGAAVCAGVAYYTVGINLRSPLPSLGALAEATPPPAQISTAATQPLPPLTTTAASTRLSPAVAVDPTAALSSHPPL